MNDFSNFREWMKKHLRNRSKTDFVIILLVGMLLMVIAIPTGGNDEAGGQNTQTQEETEDNACLTQEEYRTSLEEQLCELLTQTEGVGKCRVMITLEDSGQTYVDKNVTSEEGRQQEETVVYDDGEKDEPYVVRQEFPKVAGVVVVAEGGGNAEVATEISNAVMSLFQLEAHKITVVKMSVQEE